MLIRLSVDMLFEVVSRNDGWYWREKDSADDFTGPCPDAVHVMAALTEHLVRTKLKAADTPR
jgi:hypothetical protein